MRFPGGSKEKVPTWQRWENLALNRRVIFIRLILVVCTLSVILAGAVIYRRSHRPKVVVYRPDVVNSREPVLLGNFSCNVSKGLHAREMLAFIDNVGNQRAHNIVRTLSLRVMRPQDVKMADYHDVPRGDCNDKSLRPPATALLEPGQESSLQLEPDITAASGLKDGDYALLYATSCAYYAADSGAEHGTCDTYRLRLANGATVFRCDGTPQVGKFERAMLASCGN